jgi:tetratricopeptide (TPR) repeat protein
MLPERRLHHAQGYLSLGMLAEAAAELDRLPSPLAETPGAIGLRLAVLHEQANWPALRDLAAKLIQAGHDDTHVWVSWAYAARRADTLPAAEAILLEAEKRHPSEAVIHFNLGCYASVRGDLAVARSRVNRAVALDPDFAEAAATDPDLAALRAADCPPGA